MPGSPRRGPGIGLFLPGRSTRRPGAAHTTAPTEPGSPLGRTPVRWIASAPGKPSDRRLTRKGEENAPRPPPPGPPRRDPRGRRPKRFDPYGAWAVPRRPRVQVPTVRPSATTVGRICPPFGPLLPGHSFRSEAGARHGHGCVARYRAVLEPPHEHRGAAGGHSLGSVPQRGRPVSTGVDRRPVRPTHLPTAR